MGYKGHKVFLFHPVHIFYNTSNIEEYGQYKKDGREPSTIEPGVKDFFFKFLDLIENRGIKPIFLKEAI